MRPNFIEYLFCWSGGSAAVLIGQPLDTIKVKMQTFPHIYKSLIECFEQTFEKVFIEYLLIQKLILSNLCIQKEGIKGFYSGIYPSLAAEISEKSVLFCSYGMCQKLVAYLRQSDSIAAIDKGFAGLLALKRKFKYRII